MLYLAKTAHLQADASVDCRGIAEVDPTINPWALLVLDEGAATATPCWRLAGTFAEETDALAAHRLLSRQMTRRDCAAMSLPLNTAPRLHSRDVGGRAWG